jgi:hypothetical protein
MCRIGDRDVICLGRWLRIATIRDEEWLEGEAAPEPLQFLNALKASGLPADIFAFSDPIDGARILSGFPFEMDNAAVIRTDNYDKWWDELPQEARKNTRRAAKRGVEIRRVALDDAFIAGVKAIYDETPVRQGRLFWHYGKDVKTVRRENESYLDRCEFLGAYYQNELIGFIKYVFVGHDARIMQILCLNAHQDKRPIIALIVKAAERCHALGLKHLIYGKYTYDQKADSSITEFKKRLGFEQLEFRRYYAPLTIRGRLALSIGAHRGWKGVLPPVVVRYLLQARSWWLQRGLKSGVRQI